MTKPGRLAREARAELQDAARWYGEQRSDLRIESLALSPHLGSPPGIDPGLGVKRVFVKRFPYSVHFLELPTRFRVLAVAHARRRPRYWHGRL